MRPVRIEADVEGRTVPRHQVARGLDAGPNDDVFDAPAGAADANAVETDGCPGCATHSVGAVTDSAGRVVNDPPVGADAGVRS